MWYLLILIGTFIEGEFTLVAAGFGAANGVLHNPTIMVFAAGGAYAGDLFFFELGRRKGDVICRRWPWFGHRAKRISVLLAKRPELTLLILRFQIGLRSAGNLTVGMSGLNRKRYLLINAVACVLWAIGIVLLCHWFAKFMTALWNAVQV
jgi:membrane protein DedA with SNARE-associated domain